MGGEWQEAFLTDLYDISSGLSKPAKDFGSGYPFLAFKDVFNNFFLPGELTQLVQSSEKEQEKCSVKSGDVFLTRTSETMDELGMSSVALQDYEKATFNGFTKRLRPKEGNCLVSEYVGYFLRSPSFRREMLSFSTMSTRASLNNEMISRLKISFPSVQEQRAIAHVLKTLDNKIEINRQINTTLESMAQALFKSWFIDFDPVLDNAIMAGNPIPDELQERAKVRRAILDQNQPSPPAPLPVGEGGRRAGEGAKHEALAGKRKPLTEAIKKQFPSRFVFSEEMGWIPEGWKPKSLDQVANYQNGLALQKFRPENEDDFLPVVKIAQLRKGYADGEEKASPNITPKCIIDDGDVVFSWSGSLMVDVWCGGKAALNQHLFKVTSTSFPKWFYYWYTIHHLEEFQRIATDKAVTMGHIKREHLSQTLCAIPPSKLIQDCSGLIEGLSDRVVQNRLGNRQLETLRDTLLPKLLSGQLRIPDAERLVADAVE